MSTPEKSSEEKELVLGEPRAQVREVDKDKKVNIRKREEACKTF